jgi:hypothetical protein
MPIFYRGSRKIVCICIMLLGAKIKFYVLRLMHKPVKANNSNLLYEFYKHHFVARVF